MPAILDENGLALLDELGDVITDGTAETTTYAAFSVPQEDGKAIVVMVGY